MLKTICQYTQRQGLDLRDSFGLCLPVGHHSRQFRYLAKPAAIFFPINLNPHILNGEYTAFCHPVQRERTAHKFG
jgi:hypothetical protein